MRIVLVALFIALNILANPASAADRMQFWDTTQRGANSFNKEPPSDAYFRALRTYGATWVRLAYDKWEPAQRDFLIGNADHYRGLVDEDLKILLATLDRAHAAGLKVVVAPLSLPGARSRPNNGYVRDGRLWRDKAYWDQAAAFWRDLAVALKDHPAVIAYNLLNEPTPEKGTGLADYPSADEARRWYEAHRGSSHDLRVFYGAVIKAIREVDGSTPIMLDAGRDASADAFYWKALEDPRVLYSFHMYEPWELTSSPNMKRSRPLPYPGSAPEIGYWDRKRVTDHLRVPLKWARAQGLPPTRIVAGEFGCMRRLEFCPTYLEHVLSAVEANGFHWAFYAFREDAWDGMDYELGAQAVGAAYWSSLGRGDGDAIPRGPTPVFSPISERLKKQAVSEGSKPRR